MQFPGTVSPYGQAHYREMAQHRHMVVETEVEVGSDLQRYRELPLCCSSFHTWLTGRRCIWKA